ncbi:NAD-P-binding protein [Mycena galopus ATCC 62051]|nr:NAD-P-binding protein [Mycena galopus ATCC 62051]
MATTYSAWYATKKGYPSTAMQLKTGIPIPTKLAKGEVLVKIQAIALNPFIYKMMAGLPNFMAGRPHIVQELDAAGIVVDANGTEFKNGDLVFGTNYGSMAEYVVIPAAFLVLQPPNVTPVEAAGFPVVLLTANQAVIDLKLSAGQTVFINGGSSSVGLSAIQIAKSLGCTVVATASARNKELLLSLGVDEFIDYTRAPLVDQLCRRTGPKFHGMFDAVGLPDATMYRHSAAYLVPGGIYLSAGGFPTSGKAFLGMLRLIFEGNLRPSWLGGSPRKFGYVDRFSGETSTGTVKPIVDSVHSFDRAGVMAAYDKLMTNRAVGKVVIRIGDKSQD